MFPIVRMRCGLRPLTRVAWSALPIVLMLEAYRQTPSRSRPSAMPFGVASLPHKPHGA